jgi:hypothetical protein
MAAADDYRSVGKLRIIPLFNGSVERIAIQVRNR